MMDDLAFVHGPAHGRRGCVRGLTRARPSSADQQIRHQPARGRHVAAGKLNQRDLRCLQPLVAQGDGNQPPCLDRRHCGIARQESRRDPFARPCVCAKASEFVSLQISSRTLALAQARSISWRMPNDGSGTIDAQAREFLDRAALAVGQRMMRRNDQAQRLAHARELDQLAARSRVRTPSPRSTSLRLTISATAREPTTVIDGRDAGIIDASRSIDEIRTGNS